MAEYNKQRYYWIRLTDHFMTSDTVDFLMGQPNGSQYVVLYQMLCLKTVNNNGQLVRTIGEVIIPYDEEKIQRDTKYFSLDTVRVAMSLYKRLGLIYEQENGVFKIANFENMIGSQTISAAKKQEYRRELKQKDICPPNCLPDKDIDKEIEIDIYKERDIERETPPIEEYMYSLAWFIEKYNINSDTYSAQIHDMDFKKLDEVFNKSEWIRKNFVSLALICREYKKLVGGYYKDFEKVYTNPTKTRNERTITKEECEALIQNANDMEF